MMRLASRLRQISKVDCGGDGERLEARFCQNRRVRYYRLSGVASMDR